MIKQNDAIGDILFEAITRESSLSSFTRDNGCHALLFEPAKEATEFGAYDCFVKKCGKQSFQRIEDDTFCTDLVDCISQPQEESFEIVLTGLFDLGALDKYVVEQQLLVCD